MKLGYVHFREKHLDSQSRINEQRQKVECENFRKELIKVQNQKGASKLNEKSHCN